MISAVADAVVPGREVRTTPAAHPYTTDGLQLDARVGDAWIEIGECGLAHPDVLREANLPAGTTGLAMGLGLDRLVVIRKGLDDVRLLRSADPRVAAQLLDLSPYRPVSRQQSPVRRDLSVAVAADAGPEELGDRVREALGDRARDVEAIRVLAETPRDALPNAARSRLGIAPGQKNVLLRVILRGLERTLTAQEANALRDEIYAAIHEGSTHAWACGAPPAATRAHG
jgi:phenylalanyl-tRNA synthetase alpha chain